MKSSYKKIGPYIGIVDDRNIDGKEDNLLGVSVSKKFIKSIANTVGTDFRTYRIVKRNQFTYIPDTSRRGDKIGIALLENFDEGLVSQAYTVFEVTDTNNLLPEYLMMWFRRPEFDRYARFISHGSVREIFEWEDMCNVALPIPHIDKQREIVKEYNIIINRINLNNQLIQKLEETAQAIYKQWFVDFEFPFDFAQGVPDDEGRPYRTNGGEMEWNGELEMEVPKGWDVKTLKNVCSKIGSGATPKGGKENYFKSGISLIRSMNVFDFIFSLENLAFIDDKQSKALSNVAVQIDDVLLNITGVSVARCCKVPESVLPARVNQHVMIIRSKKEYFLSHYILCALCYSSNKSRLLGISQSGSTREAITKVEVENFNLLIPDKVVVESFDEKLRKIFDLIENTLELNKTLSELKSLLLSKLATIEN